MHDKTEDTRKRFPVRNTAPSIIVPISCFYCICMAFGEVHEVNDDAIIEFIKVRLKKFYLLMSAFDYLLASG